MPVLYTVGPTVVYHVVTSLVFGFKCLVTMWSVILTHSKHMQEGAHAPPCSPCTESNLCLFECNRIRIHFHTLLFHLLLEWVHKLLRCCRALSGWFSPLVVPIVTP